MSKIGVVPCCWYGCSRLRRDSSVSFIHDLLFSTPQCSSIIQQRSFPPSNHFHQQFRSCLTAPQPSSPPRTTPFPKSCNLPSSQYQEHRAQHRDNYTQKRPRADFAPQLIPSQLPSLIIKRADIRIVDRREERPSSWVRHAGGGLLPSAILNRSCIEGTDDSTPAARVLRMEARIAILKPPAVGEEGSWISLSIVRYGGFIQQ